MTVKTKGGSFVPMDDTVVHDPASSVLPTGAPDAMDVDKQNSVNPSSLASRTPLFTERVGPMKPWVGSRFEAHNRVVTQRPSVVNQLSVLPALPRGIATTGQVRAMAGLLHGDTSKRRKERSSATIVDN